MVMESRRAPLTISNGHELIAILKDLAEGDMTTVFLWDNVGEDREERARALSRLMAHARVCAGLEERDDIYRALGWSRTEVALYSILHSLSVDNDTSLPGKYGIYCKEVLSRRGTRSRAEIFALYNAVFVPVYTRRYNNKEGSE